MGKRAQATSSRRRKSERKITRMVIVVVAVFVLCWLPFYALNIVNLVVVLPRDLRGLYFFVVVLSYANSCANPILYGFLSDNFKRGFRKALCRSSRRVENNDRAGTEIQRPTEEWAGIALQPLKSVGVTSTHNGDHDEKEEQEAGEMSEICRPSQNGNNRGVAQGSKMPEPVQPGHSAKVGELTGEGLGVVSTDVKSTLTNHVKSGSNRSSDTSTDKNTVLEISYL